MTAQDTCIFTCEFVYKHVSKFSVHLIVANTSIKENYLQKVQKKIRNEKKNCEDRTPYCCGPTTNYKITLDLLEYLAKCINTVARKMLPFIKRCITFFFFLINSRNSINYHSNVE